uniref:Sodium channel modifier 1 n=1 Tax=Phasianus colchicus TaxID=9054 RepID=A0A669QI19_PHACC
MSFKRDGDDAGQLAVLQRRRVAELLANYIPEDEALLLRSGRYACTVCPHRPVFDTLEVLAVHRAGRKHVGSESLPPQPRRSTEMQWRPLLQFCCQGTAVGEEVGEEVSAVRAQSWTPGKYWRWDCTSPARDSLILSFLHSAEAAVDSIHTQQDGLRGAQPSPPPSQPTAVSPTRRQVLQRYLQLRSAGWIQDPSGKWVKDENAEFDSDEDEPPALLPT